MKRGDCRRDSEDTQEWQFVLTKTTAWTEKAAASWSSSAVGAECPRYGGGWAGERHAAACHAWQDYWQRAAGFDRETEEEDDQVCSELVGVPTRVTSPTMTTGSKVEGYHAELQGAQPHRALDHHCPKHQWLHLALRLFAHPGTWRGITHSFDMVARSELPAASQQVRLKELNKKVCSLYGELGTDSSNKVRMILLSTICQPKSR